MFTDLVGYSAITSENERRALKLLDEHRTLLKAVFARHRGQVVKNTGDGFLVDFASAVDAVDCAVEAQTEMRRFNEGRKEGQRALVRIGIHIGDVVHSEGDVLGDAVNVAARLEPLAEAGGICVTRQVLDQVEGKVAHRFTRIGTRELKNIRRPFELYKVDVPSGLSRSEPSALDSRRVAILPLANLSADPNDRYFAEGMTEELITTVSKISELSVISRTSVMRYRDTTMPIGEIGRELSVGTVLEGSVRKAGNKVRITTQLIDTQNDRHLWAQSYDRDMTDIFAVQGDIAEKVADALRVRLVPAEREAVEKKATANPEAYTLYLKGRHFWNERSPEGVAKAITYFEEAVKKDPGFALAYSGLADCYNIQIDRAYVSYDEGIAQAKGYAEKAVELDALLAEAHASLGLTFENMWDSARAMKEYDRAIALRPNYSLAHHWVSNLLSNTGRPDQAFAHEKRAYELDPLSSIIGQGVAVTLMELGRWQESLAQFDRVMEADPKFESAPWWKAHTLLGMGEPEQAVAAARLAGGGLAAKTCLVSALSRAGHREEALRTLHEIESSKDDGYRSPGLLGMMKFDLGDKDEAFRLLEESYSEHDGFIFYVRRLPGYGELRADPRWSQIDKKLAR
jgi:TolB-like protein/Tfp pilus assembly protein PilF